MEPTNETRNDSERSFAFFTTLIITSILPVWLLVSQRNFLAIAEDYELELSRLAYWLLQPVSIAVLGLLPMTVFIKEYVISKDTHRSWFNLIALGVGMLALFVCGYCLMSTFVNEVQIID
jgi:hypothetical protein